MLCELQPQVMRKCWAQDLAGVDFVESPIVFARYRSPKLANHNVDIIAPGLTSLIGTSVPRIAHTSRMN